MKKQKPSLVRNMWLCFASQIVMAICITTTCVFASVVCLHSAEEDSQSFARRLPAIRQHLQAEQDPDKLRREANGLLDMAVSDAESREWGLRFMVKTSAIFGFGLCVYSLALGLFAYRLQRESREKDPQ